MHFKGCPPEALATLRRRQVSNPDPARQPVGASALIHTTKLHYTPLSTRALTPRTGTSEGQPCRYLIGHLRAYLIGHLHAYLSGHLRGRPRRQAGRDENRRRPAGRSAGHSAGLGSCARDAVASDTEDGTSRPTAESGRGPALRRVGDQSVAWRGGHRLTRENKHFTSARGDECIPPHLLDLPRAATAIQQD